MLCICLTSYNPAMSTGQIPQPVFLLGISFQMACVRHRIVMFTPKQARKMAHEGAPLPVGRTVASP